MGVEVDSSLDTDRKAKLSLEVERLLADNSKAKRVLDWSPKYQGSTGLAEALSATVDWYLIPENRVKFKAGDLQYIEQMTCWRILLTTLRIAY